MAPARPLAPTDGTLRPTGRPRVAFQGERGAFGELAIATFWRDAADPIACRSFDAVVALVRDGEVEFGVVPVWNSTMGDVVAGRDAVARRDAAIDVDGEVEVPVRHCLLALPGVTLDELRVVGSHPAAIEQCTTFFAQHDWLSACVAFDTAGAARELACLAEPPRRGEEWSSESPWFTPALARRPRELGAIASARAAAHYGLAVIVHGIQNDPTNLTRFVVLRKRTA